MPRLVMLRNSESFPRSRSTPKLNGVDSEVYSASLLQVLYRFSFLPNPANEQIHMGFVLFFYLGYVNCL